MALGKEGCRVEMYGERKDTTWQEAFIQDFQMSQKILQSDALRVDFPLQGQCSSSMEPCFEKAMSKTLQTDRKI